jgi:hypothetical protein
MIDPAEGVIFFNEMPDIRPGKAALRDRRHTENRHNNGACLVIAIVRTLREMVAPPGNTSPRPASHQRPAAAMVHPHRPAVRPGDSAP